MARAEPTLAAAHCRVCWRPRGVPRLACGCVLCADCVAALAAAAFHAPAQLLPLRCPCGQAVAAAALARVLAPHQLAYYAFLARQQTDAKRALAATGEPMQTRCDLCAAPTPLDSPRAAREQLRDCGHAYCHACVATLRASADSDVLCCKELEWTRRLDTTTPTPTPPATTTRSTTTPTPVRPLPAKGKGKLAAAAVVDLADSEDEDEAAVDAAAPDEDPELCRLCGAAVDAATNRFRAACGHVFCRDCLHARSLRALQNEAQGGIGLPVRCCGALVALDVLRAVLSRRNLAKYEALVARRGDVAAAAATTRSATAAALAAPDPKRARRDDPDDKTTAPTTPCVACLGDVETSARVTSPCGHVYCLACLATMARQSLEDRALVPIRCCQQEFPVESVARVLSASEWRQYERFVRERDWRASTLKSDREYAAVVRALDGKQCPACGVGVQKEAGCDAMRCLHGHLFCFACEAAPCTCGRTRLENYGWVPPGAQAAVDQAMARARVALQQARARPKPTARRR